MFQGGGKPRPYTQAWQAASCIVGATLAVALALAGALARVVALGLKSAPMGVAPLDWGLGLCPSLP